jgi:hypothetical protein
MKKSSTDGQFFTKFDISENFTENIPAIDILFRFDIVPHILAGGGLRNGQVDAQDGAQLFTKLNTIQPKASQ